MDHFTDGIGRLLVNGATGIVAMGLARWVNGWLSSWPKGQTMEKKLITAAAMGELISVSQSTVEQWGRTGKIPRVVIGKKTVRYDPEEVVRALKTERQTA